MTSDAKVGLLLGLVFIVIIAFLMNGLPKLLDRNPSDGLIRTTAAGTSDTLGLDDQASDAVRKVRKEMIDLPFPHRRIDLKENRQKDPRFAAHNDKAVIKPAKKEVTTPAKKTVSNPQVRTYTVEDGDNLATIAKKIYGDQIGNKHATITKLFEANRNLLESPDDISIGQKLRMPNLLTTDEVKAANKLKSTGMFDKVKNTINTIAKRPSSQSRTKVYVVRDGDSLWKIAEKQLSGGNRAEEIRKLNSSILPDGDMLTIGMKLQIPQK